MIKRIHLLIFKSFIGPLILTFFIVEFVLIMQFLWVYIQDLVGKGLEWKIISELFLSIAATLVNMALPLAILLASVMTFGNLGENFELSAMKSAGISLQRIMLPLAIFSVLLGVGAFYWANNIVPYANLKSGALIYDVGRLRPELKILPGIFNRDIEGFSIKIAEKNPETAMMYDVTIYDHSQNLGNNKVTLADSCRMELTDNERYMIFVLYGGKSWEELVEIDSFKRVYPENYETFDKKTVIIELKSFDLKRTSSELFKHSYQIKTFNELSESIDTLSVSLEKRKLRFIISFGKSNFFKFRSIAALNKNKGNKKIISNKNQILQVDTVIESIEQVYDTIYNNFELRVLNAAYSDAQNTRDYIISNKNEIDERQKNIYRHQSAMYQKITLALACLIFFFIGAPLGAIIRKGGFGTPFIVSILCFILYYVISMFGKKSVEEGVLPGWQGIFLSSLAAFIVGIILIYKASNDSRIFDKDSFIDFIKSPFKVFDIQYKDPEIVYHKNVGFPLEIDLQKEIIEFGLLLKNLETELMQNIKDFKNIYFICFGKNKFNIEYFIESYNSLYNILAIKFRDRIFYRASLEKFPKIEKDQLSHFYKSKIIGKLLSTLLFIPFGLIYMLRYYLLIKNLKQKLVFINEQLNVFKT